MGLLARVIEVWVASSTPVGGMGMWHELISFVIPIDFNNDTFFNLFGSMKNALHWEVI